MIEVDSLHKTYRANSGPATEALADVSLTIEPAEFTTIVGTSGSGKTTLLNIIGGLDRDYTGRVSVDDSDNLADMPEDEVAKLRNQRFGFVFQQFHLLDHLTAVENVALPSFFGDDHGPDADAPDDPGDGGDGPDARARQLLERVGLGARLDSHPTDLSGGQRQRVAIARALFHRPRYLLCDEPTGSLDRRTGRDVMTLFETLNRESDVSVVIVTHEEHVASRTRRRIRLEDGKVVADDPVSDFEGDAARLVETEGAPTQPDAMTEDDRDDEKPGEVS